MPRNVDAFALFFIVIVMLVSGYFVDHGPWCFRNGVRMGVVDDQGIGVLAPPAMPAAPRMPDIPKMPAMPVMPRLPQM